MTLAARWILPCLLWLASGVVLAQNNSSAPQGGQPAGNPPSGFPTLTGQVVDQAQILDEATEANLTATLSKHEAATSNQVVVVTIPDLEGFSIADYTNRLGRHWGIGTAEKNNGVILLVAPEERKLRIEVGYGLEGALPDATASLIIQREIYPRFRESDYAGGVTQGVDSILKAIAGEYTPSPESAKSGNRISDKVGGFMPLFFIAIIGIPELLRRRGLRRLGNASFPAGFMGLMTTIVTGNIWIGLLLTVGVFVMAYLNSSDKPNGGSPGGGIGNPGRRGGIGGMGGGFGGGGFSGGGGSFGGGGASGSW